MRREAFSQLVVFIAVAREGSFTRAAAKLGISQSSISHTVKELERQLGLRLLRRTTRSVSLTQAGERLMQVSAPRFDEIESEISGRIVKVLADDSTPVEYDQPLFLVEPM